MDTQEYNGWTNRATWLVKLWIDNDEGSQGYWLEEAGNAAKQHGNNAKWLLADQLEGETQDTADAMASGEYGKMSDTQRAWLGDMTSAGLSHVDWAEIADSLLTDYAEIYPDEVEDEATA